MDAFNFPDPPLFRVSFALICWVLGLAVPSTLRVLDEGYGIVPATTRCLRRLVDSSLGSG